MMNTRLKKRIKNRKMASILDGKYHYRYDYTVRGFKATVWCSLAKFEK